MFHDLIEEGNSVGAKLGVIVENCPVGLGQGIRHNWAKWTKQFHCSPHYGQQYLLIARMKAFNVIMMLL